MYLKMKEIPHNKVEFSGDVENKNSFPKIIKKFNIFKIKKLMESLLYYQLL